MRSRRETDAAHGTRSSTLVIYFLITLMVESLLHTNTLGLTDGAAAMCTALLTLPSVLLR